MSCKYCPAKDVDDHAYYCTEEYAELYDALSDLVAAFGEGDDGIDCAMIICADTELFAARAALSKASTHE